MLKDLALVAACFILSNATLTQLQVPAAGALSILLTLGVASWRLRVHGGGWREIVFARPSSWLRTAGAALGWMLLAYFLAAVATVIATKGLGLPAIDASRYGQLQGNLPRWLFLLGITWTIAAIGEELLFRGFLLNRLQILLGAGRIATVAAVVLQALAFGFSHAFQGWTGILVTGAVGLVFGTAAVLRRNLGAIMIAHGLIDTASLSALYFGLAPGG